MVFLDFLDLKKVVVTNIVVVLMNDKTYYKNITCYPTGYQHLEVVSEFFFYS
jgi:hypothetical protein